MEAAAKFGKSPFEFMGLSDMERAVMVAHFLEARLRKSHADHAQSEVQEKNSKKSPSSPLSSAHGDFFGGA